MCHFMNCHITGCFYVSMEYSRNVNVIPRWWITKKSWDVMRAKLKNSHQHRLSLDWWTISTTVCSTHTQRWTSGILRCVWKLWQIPRRGLGFEITYKRVVLSTRPLLLLGRSVRRGLWLAGQFPVSGLYVWDMFWYSKRGEKDQVAVYQFVNCPLSVAFV